MYRIQLEENVNFGKSNLGSPIDNSEAVSTEIRSIERGQANAELEKDEIVFNPKTLAMHRVIGKWHKDGGVNTNLDEGSFIFSNFKDLAINKKEKSQFEFRMGGSYKPHNNTPAKVLMKEIDLPHHNKMVNILQSKTQDDIAKNSAALMIAKNIEKAGRVAYLQEKKKNFEDGLPEFAQNTAPVYDDYTNNQISQSQQYMKRGGLKKYQMGITNFPNSDFYNKVYGSNYVPSTVSNKFGMLNGYPSFMQSPTQSYAQFPSSFSMQSMLNPKTDWASSQQNYDNSVNAKRVAEFEKTAQQANTGLHPNKAVDTNSNLAGKQIPLTGYQYLNALYPLMQRVRTQRPMRMEIPQMVVPEMEMMDVQPFLSNIDQQMSLSRRLARTVNPAQANIVNQSIYGQGLDARNQAISQVTNQNREMRNRMAMNIADAYNKRNMGMAQANQDYYQKSQLADLNRESMKSALKNQSMSIFNKYISDNQALQNTFNTLYAPYQDKNKQTPYNIIPSFFGYSTPFNPKWEGDIMSVKTGVKDSSDFYTQIVNGMQEAMKSGDIEKATNLAKIAAGFKSAMSSFDTPTSNKQRGGRFNFRKLNFSR